jgi:hypothetical protein
VPAALVKKFPEEVKAFIEERFEVAKPTGETSTGFFEGDDWAKGASGDMVFFVTSTTPTSEHRTALGVWTGVPLSPSKTPPAYHTCDRPTNDDLRDIYLSRKTKEERIGDLEKKANDPLKRVLKDWGLLVGGNKADLARRIFTYLEGHHGTAETHPNREKAAEEEMVAAPTT